MFQHITIKKTRDLFSTARALAPGHDANHQLLYALAAEHYVSRGCPLFFLSESLSQRLTANGQGCFHHPKITRKRYPLCTRGSRVCCYQTLDDHSKWAVAAKAATPLYWWVDEWEIYGLWKSSITWIEYIYISPHNHQGFEHCSSNKWLLKLQVSMEYCTSTNEGLLKYRFYRLLNCDGSIVDSGWFSWLIVW